MAMKLRNRLLLLNVAVIGTTTLLMTGLVYVLASHQIRKEMWGFLSDEFNVNFRIFYKGLSGWS